MASRFKAMRLEIETLKEQIATLEHAADKAKDLNKNHDEEMSEEYGVLRDTCDENMDEDNQSEHSESSLCEDPRKVGSKLQELIDASHEKCHVSVRVSESVIAAELKSLRKAVVPLENTVRGLADMVSALVPRIDSLENANRKHVERQKKMDETLRTYETELRSYRRVLTAFRSFAKCLKANLYITLIDTLPQCAKSSSEALHEIAKSRVLTLYTASFWNIAKD